MRKIFKYLFIFIFSLSLDVSRASADGIVAYIPTVLPISLIEKKIKSSTSLSVTAFAKYSDFESAVNSLNPDYVISTAAFSSINENFEPISGLKVNGETKSKFILLALKPGWKDKDILQARTGTVEFIKRNKIKDYLEKVFERKFASIKTVSKVEDLFPLLVFDSVDVIALQPHTYAELKGKFQTNVFEVGNSQEIESMTLFRRKGIATEMNAQELKKFEYMSK